MFIRRLCLLACGTVAACAVTVSAPAYANHADAEPQVIEIHSMKFGYSPSEITLHKGQPYKLHLTTDDVSHSLRIKPLGVNAVMKPGQFNDVLLTPDQVGDFKGDCGVYCGVGHVKMAMTVHVVE